MPALEIHIRGTFEKEDLISRVAPFASDVVIAAALLSPLDIREQEIITLLTNTDCKPEDAIRIMREVKGLLGRRVNGRNMKAYGVIAEFGQAFLDNQRRNHREK